MRPSCLKCGLRAHTVSVGSKGGVVQFVCGGVGEPAVVVGAVVTSVVTVTRHDSYVGDGRVA